jgi:Carbon-nitrogen hydrolase
MGVGKKKVLGGREIVTVAIVQKASRFLDKEASLTRAEDYIAEAATGGAQLIVFPEVWLAGYPYYRRLRRCKPGLAAASLFVMPPCLLRAKTPGVWAQRLDVPTRMWSWAATKSIRVLK